MVRGIRGATTAVNTVESITAATRQLLEEMVAVNRLQPEELVAAIFALTPDLTASFAAPAARQLGWQLVPLLDHVSPQVSAAPSGCIRVLLLWNTDKSQSEIRHVYQAGAQQLRPDLQEVSRP